MCPGFKFLVDKFKKAIAFRIITILFGSIWNGRSNIAQFWFSKSFFYVKKSAESFFFFIEEYEIRRTTFIFDIFQ